jgi:hypothetical protein
MQDSLFIFRHLTIIAAATEGTPLPVFWAIKIMKIKLL